MRRATTAIAIAAASLAGAGAAHAQAGPAPESGGAAPPSTDTSGAGGGAGNAGGAGAQGAQPGPAGTTTTQAPAGAFGYGNPQSSNGTIGGGNATESSSHPVTGDQEDTFDLGSSAGHGTTGDGQGGGASHGASNGPIFIGKPTYQGTEAPDTHLVRRGDTLWGLCDFYFQNPYEWPRIWAYNPQIKNPHWIYPGDEVRLKEGADASALASKGPVDQSKLSLVDRRRQVPEGTVFLRDTGWIHDDGDTKWGTLTGSSQDKMFLSDLDEVYLTMDPGHDVQLGQELSVFRPRKTVAAGEIVQVLGTVRVDQYDAPQHTARARVVESLDVIERGASVGPVDRKFVVVPPVRNDADVQAHVLASLHPNEFFGQEQVVFIDKGGSAGLKAGNRLFIIRRGDAWRRSLVTPGAGYRVSADDERPMPPMEKTPGAPHEEEKYPDEVIAELRVLAVKKESAVCLVTQARLEIELNDLAVARKGY
ncbi:MAG TPA: LysM peptidoglycan-binding domain-containing protein [Polyangiaceae bacterium]|nr:LysM peptidoglycan-binding domain-containing protein [Polyangiaceae bacterium]